MVLNGWLPTWVTSFTLIFFLCYVAWGSTTKAQSLFQKERSEQSSSQGHQDQEQRLLSDHETNGGAGVLPPKNVVIDWCKCALGVQTAAILMSEQ